MTFPHGDQAPQDDRLLLMLQRLLEIRSVDFRATFTEAATIIADAFGADKADVFVLQPARNSLVALGTSRTPMGERSRRSAWTCCPWPTVAACPGSSRRARPT